MTRPAALRPGEVLILDPADDFEATVRRHAVGRPLLRGFVPPAEPWDLTDRRVLAAGDVTDESAARAALMCAVRGAALVVRLDRRAPWAAAFLADLSRLTPQAAPDAAGDSPGLAGLNDEQRQVLDLLVDGQSIAAAAQTLFLSLRTTNRRVAEARKVLGVSTTREAVLAYAKLRS